MDFERAAGTLDGASFTGFQTRSGEPIAFRFRGLPVAAELNQAFVTLAHDVFINIHRGGCDVSY